MSKVHGNVVIGPTAEEVDIRENAVVEDSSKHQLLEEAYRIIPDLRLQQVVGCYAGLRPGTETKDYQMYPNKDK